MKKVFKFNPEKLKEISKKVKDAENLSEEELLEMLKEMENIEPQSITISILMISLGILCILWLKYEFLACKAIRNLWPAGTLGIILISFGIQQIFERKDFRKNFQREHSLLYSKIVNALNAL